MATLFKLGTRGYHATVNEFQGQIRVHIRKYMYTNFPADSEKFPTKHGIALTIEEFEELKKVITDLSEMLDAMVDTCSMTTQPGNDRGLISTIEGQSLATLFKLGTRGYHATVNEFQGQILIHIRKYTHFSDSEKFPTKYGIALTIEEFEELKKVITDLSDMAYVIAETIHPGDQARIQNQQVIDPQMPNHASYTKPRDDQGLISSIEDKSKQKMQQEFLTVPELENNNHSDTQADQNQCNFQLEKVIKSPPVCKGRKGVRSKKKPYDKHLVF